MLERGTICGYRLKRFSTHMKTLMATTLILLGAIWLFYATVNKDIVRVRALSDAMQLESDLNRWAHEKVLTGRLEEEDVSELFSDGYSLRLGGEAPNKNFRKMINEISQSGAPPLWPGFIAIFVGSIGALGSLSARTKKLRERTQ